MHQDEIIFVINEHERIQVPLPCELDDVSLFDWADAEYIHDGECKYPIYSGFDFGHFINVFCDALKAVLTGGCTLDESLQENLGYLWNVYLDTSTNAPEGHPLPTWIGMQYLIGGTLDVDVWIYEKEGKIFFEITPIYKWHYRDPEPEAEGYITFGEFIKNYKPYVIAELSIETVREWLRQVEYLQALVKINYERYKNLSDEDRDSAS